MDSMMASSESGRGGPTTSSKHRRRGPEEEEEEGRGGSNHRQTTSSSSRTGRGCPSHLRRETWDSAQFETLEIVYSGTASRVYRAKCLLTGEQVILKRYDKSKLDALTTSQISREIHIHCRLQHPHLASLYGVFEEGLFIYLVQEWAHMGDLFSVQEHLPSNKFDESDLAEHVIKPLIDVLEYLHDQGIIHRDIKTENVMFAEGLHLKLSDFGLSIDQTLERPVSRVGTADYMAPEILSNPGQKYPNENKDNDLLAYTSSVDIWALGILTYELLDGKPPFETQSMTAREILALIAQEGSLRRPSNVSDVSWDFVESCLNLQPSSRPSCRDLKLHPFLRSKARRLRRTASMSALKCRSLAVSEDLKKADKLSRGQTPDKPRAKPPVRASQTFAERFRPFSRAAKGVSQSVTDVHEEHAAASMPARIAASFSGLKLRNKGPNQAAHRATSSQSPTKSSAFRASSCSPSPPKPAPAAQSSPRSVLGISRGLESTQFFSVSGEATQGNSRLPSMLARGISLKKSAANSSPSPADASPVSSKHSSVHAQIAQRDSYRRVQSCNEAQAVAESSCQPVANQLQFFDSVSFIQKRRPLK